MITYTTMTMFCNVPLENHECLYLSAMVARAGLKGSPANKMAEVISLQFDRGLKSDPWGLHAS